MRRDTARRRLSDCNQKSPLTAAFGCGLAHELDSPRNFP
jgi:hypothetical protein